MVNNIYDYRNTTRMQYLHIGVFPLKQQSVILVFYHKRDKLLQKSETSVQFILSEKVFQFLNYLIFGYTENFFISPQIERRN